MQKDFDTFILENPESNSLDAAFVFARASATQIHCAKSLQISPIGRSVYAYIPVPIVENNYSIGDGVGTCWAATMASKISYQKSLSTTLSAKDVFYKCWATVNYDANNLPKGNDTWYNIAAKQYSIPLYTSNSPVSKEAINSQLKVGKAVQISIFHPENGVNFSHSVLINGIDAVGEYCELVLMDPDVSSYVYISVPYSALEDGRDFYYEAPYGTVFNYWAQSRY